MTTHKKKIRIATKKQVAKAGKAVRKAYAGTFKELKKRERVNVKLRNTLKKCAKEIIQQFITNSYTPDRGYDSYSDGADIILNHFPQLYTPYNKKTASNK